VDVQNFFGSIAAAEPIILRKDEQQRPPNNRPTRNHGGSSLGWRILDITMQPFGRKKRATSRATIPPKETPPMKEWQGSWLAILEA
jgi:hypothetical protein